MSDGYIPKSVMPISGSMDVKPDFAIQNHDAFGVSSSANIGSASQTANIGDTQLRKISPYEVDGIAAPQNYSVTGLSVADHSAATSFLERFSSFFSFMSGREGVGSATDSQKNITGLGGDGDSPKTTRALHEFEKMQQVSVGYTLLSSLTQSVLSSVKRLTQGQ